MACALLPSGAFAASAGSPDPTFGSGGYALYQLGHGSGPYSAFDAVAPAPDSALYAAGESGDGQGEGEILTARIKENGALDPSFGSGGWFANKPLSYFGAVQYIHTALLEPDERLVVAGDVIERIASSGAFDPSFSFNAPDMSQVRVLRLLPEGKLLLAGGQGESPGVNPARVERTLSDGQPDPSFGDEGVVSLPIKSGAFSHMEIRGLMLLAGGAMLVSGYGGVEGSHFLWLARLTSTGQLDTSFGTGGFAYVEPAAGPGVVMPAGVGVAIVGTTYTPGPNSETSQRFAAWGFSLAGKPNPAFGSAGVSVVPISSGYNCAELWGAGMDQSGRLLFAGRERDVVYEANTSYELPVVARMNPDGSVDTSFGHNGIAFGPTPGVFLAVASDSKGRVVAAGTDFKKAWYEPTGPPLQEALVERFFSSAAQAQELATESGGSSGSAGQARELPTESTGVTGAGLPGSAASQGMIGPLSSAVHSASSRTAPGGVLAGVATFKSRAGRVVARARLKCFQASGSVRCAMAVVTTRRARAMTLRLQRHSTSYLSANKAPTTRGRSLTLHLARGLVPGAYTLRLTLLQGARTHDYSSPITLRTER